MNTVTPVCKGQNVNASGISNVCIALSSVIGKLFVNFMQSWYSDILMSSEQLIGFKPKHLTSFFLHNGTERNISVL
jgi:hypothetical protein